MNARAISIGLLLLLVSFGPESVAQRDDLRKKRSDLEKLRRDIDTYEQKIKQKERKEHSTLELLDSYDHQASLLRKLINRLRDEGTALQHDINHTRSLIGGLNDRVSFLKDQYAQYVAAAYKFGRTYDLELLLTAGSLNEMLIRSQYLKRFSEQRRSDIGEARLPESTSVRQLHSRANQPRSFLQFRSWHCSKYPVSQLTDLVYIRARIVLSTLHRRFWLFPHCRMRK